MKNIYEPVRKKQSNKKLGKSHEQVFCRRENRTVNKYIFKMLLVITNQGNIVYIKTTERDYLNPPARKNLSHLDTKGS